MVFSNKIELLLLLLTCFVKANPLIAVITLTLKGKDGGKRLHDRSHPIPTFIRCVSVRQLLILVIKETDSLW